MTGVVSENMIAIREQVKSFISILCLDFLEPYWCLRNILRFVGLSKCQALFRFKLFEESVFLKKLTMNKRIVLFVLSIKREQQHRKTERT